MELTKKIKIEDVNSLNMAISAILGAYADERVSAYRFKWTGYKERAESSYLYGQCVAVPLKTIDGKEKRLKALYITIQGVDRKSRVNMSVPAEFRRGDTFSLDLNPGQSPLSIMDALDAINSDPWEFQKTIRQALHRLFEAAEAEWDRYNDEWENNPVAGGAH
jgi:hypothetical protein